MSKALVGKICILCDKDFSLCKCYEAGEKKTREAAKQARENRKKKNGNYIVNSLDKRAGIKYIIG